MAAGAAAGGLTSLLVYPGGWSKLSKIQMVSNYGKSTGLTKNGILNFYKGFGISAAGVMVYRSVYFGGYETAKNVIFPEWEEKSFGEKYMVAFGVTNLAILLSNPVDIVRRRRLVASGSDTSLLDCVKRIYREEGLKAFVKGSRGGWISGIAASLNFVLYDDIKEALLLFENKKTRI